MICWAWRAGDEPVEPERKNRGLEKNALGDGIA